MRSEPLQSVTTLCLVRHGESTWNAERRIQGQLDPPLSPLGLVQADRVAKRLAREQWSVLYSSDLSRAYQTAQAVSASIGLPIQVTPALREQGQGKREGMLLADANIRYPDPNAPEVGRETQEALRARAVDAYSAIRDAHPGERVVVVAHGALMGAFLRAILGPLDGLKIKNTSCTLLHWDGQGWQCEYLADASHLEDDVQPDLPVADAQ